MALPTTQAGAVALLTAIVGIVVGFVPSWAPYKAEVISIGGAVLGVVFMIVNEIRAHSDAKERIAKIDARRSVKP